MSKIILATNNKNKIREMTTILAPYFDEILSLSESGIDIEIEETGATFFENAMIKAKTIYNLTKIPSLSDDSGLMTEALNGAPGVFSARYAGEKCIDVENNALLLRNLSGVTDRRAKFVCCIVLYYGEGKFVSGTGEATGEIVDKPIGTSGFGYDPLFYSDDLLKTFGEASSEEKNKVSHRFRAIEDLASKLKSDKIKL